MQYQSKCNILQWFKTLHADISSCVLNNGHASCFFPINRGVRQGCPLSGLLFVIGLELLAGLWKDRPDTPFNFNYPQDPICALGVFFSYNTPEADKLNFGDKLCSMEKVLNAWKCRKLTLIGRINIAKTLALSKLIFNASNLYVPPHVIDEANVNKLIFNFIWEGKPPKIKKSTTIGEKVNGGLKMLDFGIMEIALKISWIQRIQQNSDAGWKAIPGRLVGDLGGLTFLSHYRYDINLIQLHNLPPFYRSLLKYWQVYRSDFTDDNTQIQNEIIWNNSNILINKNTIFFNQWYQNGIIRLQDLLDVDCTFLSLQKFQQKLGLHVPFTTYYGLINYIPASWRRKLKLSDHLNQSSSLDSPNMNITTRSAYAAILDHFFQPPTSEMAFSFFFLKKA